ncbi:MAG: FAD-dependent oxidoreductase [Actinomycetota bacterium]|nr:FAD-dependent oxidoreductase [Actinomycetota bacterium]
MQNFDLIIVGACSAAAAAAVRAAREGVRIALIERGTIGGTCVNVGCVPSKHLLRAGEIYYYAKHNNFRSITGAENLGLDFRQAIEEKRRLVAELRHDKYEKTLNDIPRLTKFQGSAIFAGPHEISVNGRSIGGEKIIIAGGSSPFIPPIEGIDRVDYLTNVEALQLEELPESMSAVKPASTEAGNSWRRPAARRTPRGWGWKPSALS